jgi:diadenylate cyclase
MDIFKDIWSYFSKYTGGFEAYGIIRLVIDLLLISFLTFSAIIFLARKTKQSAMRKILITFIVVILIVFLMDLRIMQELLRESISILIILFIVVYAQEIKTFLGFYVRSKNHKGLLNSEEKKDRLINTLISTVSYLSRRSIGAIITIEKDNSLNSYIEKAIYLDAEVSFELFSTIFTPGTPLHDGAVIVRGNRAMCAGAFFPSSDKYDIPKSLGSRHRAALGISEVSDAFTIVVSEQTGNISTTIDGVININISLDDLRMSLKQNILLR